MQWIAELVERQRLDVKLDIGALAVWFGARENAKLRRRHGQRTAAAEGIVDAHQAAPQQRVVSLIERTDAEDLVDRALLQVILQIASDAGAIQHDLDTERTEPVRRPD